MSLMTKLLRLLALILLSILLATPRAWASSMKAYKEDLIIQLDALANDMKDSIRFRCEQGQKKIDELNKSKNAKICLDPHIDFAGPTNQKTAEACMAFVSYVNMISIEDGYLPNREETVRNAKGKNAAWLNKVAKSPENSLKRFLFGAVVFGILDNVFKQELEKVHETFREQQENLRAECWYEYIDIEEDPIAYAICFREGVERAFGMDRKNELFDMTNQIDPDVESKKNGARRVNTIKKVDRSCPSERIASNIVVKIDRKYKELQILIEEYTDKIK